jgi:hypothetical protein
MQFNATQWWQCNTIFNAVQCNAVQYNIHTTCCIRYTQTRAEGESLIIQLGRPSKNYNKMYCDIDIRGTKSCIFPLSGFLMEK